MLAYERVLQHMCVKLHRKQSLDRSSDFMSWKTKTTIKKYDSVNFMEVVGRPTNIMVNPAIMKQCVFPLVLWLR